VNADWLGTPRLRTFIKTWRAFGAPSYFQKKLAQIHLVIFKKNAHFNFEK